MGLCFIEAPDCIAQKRNKFRLRSPAESFGNVGHDGFRGVVDLHDQPLITSEWLRFRELKDPLRPLPCPLPTQEVGEGSDAGHGASPRELKKLSWDFEY